MKARKKACSFARLPSAATKTVMKAMKVRSAFTTKASMKAAKTTKRVSMIGSKSEVLKGKKAKTKAGLRAPDLMKNKKGKVVSKRKHAAGQKAFEKNLANWVNAMKKARVELGLTGFVAVK